MSVVVNTEPASPNNPILDLESRIIKLCQDYPKGIARSVLQSKLQNIDGQQLVTATNRLSAQGRLGFILQGKELIFQLKDPNAADKIRGSDNEEKVVYQIIAQAGNTGIWIRDIRTKSGLSQTLINKILKGLENKKIIKSVKLVRAAKKKVYMLYDLEPSRTLTGGAWYSDQDFDSPFVDLLNEMCYKFLQDKAKKASGQMNPLIRRLEASATLEQIWTYIKCSGIIKHQLSIEEIEAIMNALIYDGKIEKTLKVNDVAKSSHDASHSNVYRSIEPMIQNVGLMQMPCGSCPVVNRCTEDGAISPSTCVYMKEWLQY